MSHMHCDRAVEFLFGAATPSEVEARALEEHLKSCASCREFRSRLESPGVDLVADVLARTAGNACESAASQIFSPDAGAASEPLRHHLEACESCAALFQARERMLAVLPRLAVLDPGDVFTARVLARTRVEGRRRHWMEYPVEWAYGIAVAIVLLMIVPASPLHGSSQELLEWLRGGEAETPRGAGWAEATVIPLARVPAGAVREGTRLGEEFEMAASERATQVSWALDSVGGHFVELGGALTERKWEELRPLLGEMQCDIRLVWRGIRGELQDEKDRDC